MLRTEIRRVTLDRSLLRQDKIESGKSAMDGERNSQLHKEKIEKLKAERYELQRAVFDLKRRADDADRKHFDLKIKFRQMEKIDSQKQSFSVGKQTPLMKSPSWKAQVSVTSQDQLSESQSGVPSVIADRSTVGERIMQELPGTL